VQRNLRAWLRSFLGTALPVFALLVLFELSARALGETTVLLNSLGLWMSAQEFLLSVAAFAFVNLPLVFAEVFWPGSKTKRNYLVAVKFWLMFLVVRYGWSKIAISLRASLGVVPLIAWKVEGNAGAPAHPIVIAIGIVVSLGLYDFLYYWFHRAQHHFAVLWRFHRVHHSIVNLNCLNSYHHVVEDVLRFPFVTIPLAFLLKVDVPQLVLLSAFVTTWGQYIHSDTRINLGRLGPVFADNAYHRVHHSNLEGHRNKNFAAFFPIWDQVFGTYQRYDRDSFPAVGLVDLPPPVTVRDYLFMPFRKLKGRGVVS